MALRVIDILLVVSFFACLHKIQASSKCYQPKTIDYSLRQVYCDQPAFAVFLPKYPEFQLIDNMCLTLFPLPEDPDTFTVYQATVYCDGSTDIVTTVTTDVRIGQRISANPYLTVRDSIVGYATCDASAVVIVYRCNEFGVTETVPSYALGFSSKPIGLSCLHKVQEVLNDLCLPDEEYYILPMKLPNRCVTQQLCLQPPNPFYNKLPPSVALY